MSSENCALPSRIGTMRVRSSTVPGSAPKSGWVVMVACSPTSMLRISTFSVSPGRAPLTAIGPVAGLTLSQPTVLNSWDSSVIVLEKQSRVRTVTSSPLST